MPSAPAISVGNGAAAALDQFAALVAARTGLQFPEDRRRDLLRAARALAPACEDCTESFLQSLAAAPFSDRQIEILTAHLTVGETCFFREMKSLDAFRDHVVPELLRRRAADKRLRVWSAGCSTGEEAYTLAMILAESIPNLSAWDVEILATDINPQSIEKARCGVYTEWSFRGTSEVHRERYFEPAGPKAFAVRPPFKDMVSFACTNLATDAYPSLTNNINAMDVIFCRNVMMYFVPELVPNVVRRFYRSLVEGGWLIVAAAESSLLHASEFVSIPVDGATLYHKRKAAAAAATLPVPLIAAEPVVEGNKAALPTPSKKTAPARIDKMSPASCPNGVSSPYEEALAAYQTGQYAEAAAKLHGAFGPSGPADYEPGAAANSFALMARIDANRGKLDQANQWAQESIAVDKINPGLYYLLATILEEQHRPNDAVQAIKRALYLDSSFVLAHFALGNIILRERGRAEAKRHFQNAAAILAGMPKEEVVPESEGVTAGGLLKIIEIIAAKGACA